MKENIFKIFNLSKKRSGGGKNTEWVEYEANNLYPLKLLEYYYNIPLHSGILNKKIDMVKGVWIEPTNPQAIKFAEQINIWELWDKITTDFVIFNSFTIQVIHNGMGIVSDLIHYPTQNIRIGFEMEASEKGNTRQKKNIWISQDWENISEYEPRKFPLYNFKPINEPSFYYFGNYTVGRNIYPLATYNSAFKELEIYLEIQKLKLNNIKNTFLPSGIIQLPDNIESELKIEILSEFENNFVGVENAGKLMVLFTNPEGNNVTWIPFAKSESNITDIDTYLLQFESALITAHQISSPALIGLPGGATLNGEGSTIEAASKQLENQISGIQSKLTTELSRLFLKAGYETEFKIYQLTDKETIIEEEGVVSNII